MKRGGGISWVRVTDEIKRFVRRHGAEAPRRAVLCTYDFHTERFNSLVSPLLSQPRRPFRTMVLADAGALQARLSQGHTPPFGHYQIAPVRCAKGGVFHPKLLYIRAGNSVLVGVGSSNLTAGGLGGNLELMLFVEGGIEEKGQPLVAAAANFLAGLVARSHSDLVLPSSARGFLTTMVDGATGSYGNSVLFDTFNEPLIDQMARLVGGNTKELRVLSPWHSAGEQVDGVDAKMAMHLKRRFPVPLTVYTGSKGGKAPRLGSGVAVRVRADAVANPEGSADADDIAEIVLEARRVPVEVHAKAYLFTARRGGGYLFFGSANCTQPALCKTVRNGGNVELLVGCRLRGGDLENWKKDLDGLFLEAPAFVEVKKSPPPALPSGKVLSGEVLVTGVGGPRRLVLDLVGDVFGSVVVAGDPTGKSAVTLPAKGPQVQIDDGRILKKLVATDKFDVSKGAFGSVLYERVGSKWIPFPVCVPVFGSIASDPIEALEDLVFEELGQWRNAWDSGAQPPDLEAHDDSIQDEFAEQDRNDLAVARHQGRLDRLAVGITILRRRLVRGKYGSNRVAVIQEQLRKTGLPAHLLSVVIPYLVGERKG